MHINARVSFVVCDVWLPSVVSVPVGSHKVFPNVTRVFQAYHGHAQALEVLLQGAREVDQGDEAGRTALALASLRGHTDCVHTLLSQGASPHAVDTQYGRSAVHLAGKGAQPRGSAKEAQPRGLSQGAQPRGSAEEAQPRGLA